MSGLRGPAGTFASVSHGVEQGGQTGYPHLLTPPETQNFGERRKPANWPTVQIVGGALGVKEF